MAANPLPSRNKTGLATGKLMKPFEAGAPSVSPVPNVTVRATLGMVNTAASSSRVNRTHRVVRERATLLKARRSRVRSLLLPLLICSVLLIAVCFAVWSVLAQYEQTPDGAPGASNQMIVLILWSLPVSAALLAVVWYRQSKGQSEGEQGE